MRYEEAKKIGEACGLEHPAEFVNNIDMHAMNIFVYEAIPREIAELKEDAAKHGVQFSKVCGCAVLEGDSVDDYCYICRKLKEASHE